MQLTLCSCSAVGEADRGAVKVAEWQETLYGIDSGIQSGATTVRDEDGEYTSTTHYTMTTTSKSEGPGKRGSSMYFYLCFNFMWPRGLIIFIISLPNRLGFPVHSDQSPAGTCRDVPRDAGGRREHLVYSDGSVPDDQRPAAGRTFPIAEDRHRPSDQLPRRRRTGHTCRA